MSTSKKCRMVAAVTVCMIFSASIATADMLMRFDNIPYGISGDIVTLHAPLSVYYFDLDTTDGITPSPDTWAEMTMTAMLNTGSMDGSIFVTAGSATYSANITLNGFDPAYGVYYGMTTDGAWTGDTSDFDGFDVGPLYGDAVGGSLFAWDQGGEQVSWAISEGRGNEGVPVPLAVWSGLALLGMVGAVRTVRRRATM